EIEKETAQMWRSQVWQQTFNRWQSCYFLGQRPTSVTVQYYDSNNTIQTVSTTDYYYLQSPLPKIIFDCNYSLPTYKSRPDAIVITLTQADRTVDPLAKALCCGIASELNENRETNVIGIITKNPEYERARDLLRRGRIG